ncbi:unnamed protein product [Lota lota]
MATDHICKAGDHKGSGTHSVRSLERSERLSHSQPQRVQEWFDAEDESPIEASPTRAVLCYREETLCLSRRTMPGEDSQPPQARQRKKSKKGRSSKAKGRPPPLGAQGSLDGPDEKPLLPPPVLRPPPPRGPVGLQVRMEEESSRAVCLQVLLPFLMAGMGMVLAGTVLDHVQITAYLYLVRFNQSDHSTSVPSPYMWYVSPLVCVFFLCLTPLWVLVARRSPPIREVLRSGWQPVIVAMSISSIGGLILDRTVSDPNFKGMAVFTPVINGVGGNLVAIQASRISTYLHFWSIPGVLPYKMRQHWPNPCISFFSSGVNSRSARVLLMLVVPGHMVFLYAISLLQGTDGPAIGVPFTACYLVAALLQVAILLYVADLIVRVMWRRSLDPDNFSIPYLTALGDLLGTGFLALCFRCVSLVHGLGL